MPKNPKRVCVLDHWPGRIAIRHAFSGHDIGGDILTMAVLPFLVMGTLIGGSIALFVSGNHWLGTSMVVLLAASTPPCTMLLYNIYYQRIIVYSSGVALLYYSGRCRILSRRNINWASIIERSVLSSNLYTPRAFQWRRAAIRYVRIAIKTKKIDRYRSTNVSFSVR